MFEGLEMWQMICLILSIVWLVVGILWMEKSSRGYGSLLAGSLTLLGAGGLFLLAGLSKQRQQPTPSPFVLDEFRPMQQLERNPLPTDAPAIDLEIDRDDDVIIVNGAP